MLANLFNLLKPHFPGLTNRMLYIYMSLGKHEPACLGQLGVLPGNSPSFTSICAPALLVKRAQDKFVPLWGLRVCEAGCFQQFRAAPVALQLTTVSADSSVCVPPGSQLISFFLPRALLSGFPEPGCLPLSCKSQGKTFSLPFPTQLISQPQDFKRHAPLKFAVFCT